jgi:hypothetical protein
MNAESACRTMLTEQSKICSHVDMECSCPQVYIQLNENKQMCMKMAKKVLDGGIIGFFCVCVLSFFVLFCFVLFWFWGLNPGPLPLYHWATSPARSQCSEHPEVLIRCVWKERRLKATVLRQMEALSTYSGGAASVSRVQIGPRDK